MGYQFPPQNPQTDPQNQPYQAATPAVMAPPPAYVRTNLGDYWRNAPNGKRNLSILAAVFVVLLIIGTVSRGGASDTTGTTSTAGNSSNQASAGGSQPAATTAPKSWTTVTSFKGNGQKKTATFTVGDHWKIAWTCTPSSFYGGKYNIIMMVGTRSDGDGDVAVNTICKAGNTSGDTEEYTSGAYYLDINSEAAWAVTIQDDK